MRTLIKQQPQSIIPYKYDKPTGESDSTKTYSDLATKVFKLREEVFKIRPILKQIFEINQHKTLYDYEREQMRESLNTVPEKRKSQFLDVLKDEITKQLGSEVAEKSIKQLNKYYYVSTTLHHGPLSQPNITNALIASALPYLFDDNIDLTSIVVLACSNISFDNSLTNSREISFKSNHQNDIQLNSVTFFPRKVRPFPLFNYGPYPQEAIDKAKQTLLNLTKDGAIAHTQAEKVTKILDDVYSHKNIISSQNFSDQATRTNYMLFKEHMSFGKKMPDLVYLNQERIVLDILSKHHMKEPTTLHKLLFSTKYHELTEKYFDGISGAFTLEKQAGTFLFWAIPQGEKYRMQLWRKGNILTTEDASYSVELTPSAIQKAMDNRELIPSTLLSFITMSFYYGVRLIGGLNQPTYFTQMKKNFIALQKEVGDIEDIEVYKDLPTDSMSFWRPLLAFISNGKEISSATGLDVIMNGGNDFWEKMKDLAKKITIGDALHRGLPGVYKTYYPYDQQEESLLSLTEKDIEKVTGLDKKIVPFAEI
ncbi:MAG TPA: hypothetical protein VM077_05330 [Candidatus Limnocylindrales bacterium]|nr:hypothetical protein [Candidatus Limnocylindrales bacterium]